MRQKAGHIGTCLRRTEKFLIRNDRSMGKMRKIFVSRSLWVIGSKQDTLWRFGAEGGVVAIVKKLC